MSHHLKMILGCVLPLLLIFVLPLFGVSEGITFFVFIVLMFACHLMMLGHGHGDAHHHNGEHGEHPKGDSDERA